MVHCEKTQQAILMRSLWQMGISRVDADSLMVYRQWVRARQAAGLPRELVLYCARHDFGSFVLAKTGNLKAVMNAMGHDDVRSAMVYQHPEGEIIRNALNARHISRPTVPDDNQASA